MSTVLDPVTGKPIERARRVPVLINYNVGKERFEKKPDQYDLDILDRIEQYSLPYWVPNRRIDEDIDLWYERDYRSLGIYRIDNLFSRRNLIMVSYFRERITNSAERERQFLWFWFQSVLMGFSLMNRYLKNAFSQVNRILSGTLYIGAMQSEVSPWYALEGKIKRLKGFNFARINHCINITGSTTNINLPDNSIDYIFTDPPFGSNIIYSDLSIVCESWLNVFTNTKSEAVIHRRKQKNATTLDIYTYMMTLCFQEMHRVLKPGRWMTVEFSNTRAAVWNALQMALTQAGFVVANVSALDKQVGSFKAVTTPTAVKQDLVISCYKPNGGLEERFKLEQGSEIGAWEFIDSHLRYLPVFLSKDSHTIEVVERTPRILYDRLVAYFVQHGYSVPLSAHEFQAGLVQRFPERDGIFFLPEQVAVYERKRMTVREVQQLEIFVRDSKKLNHPTWCIMRSRLTCAGGSTMELTDSLKALFIETATTLTGSARRLFMARTVKELGPGGQRRAERELGWNRETIRKGSRELESGLICLDNFAARGRKPSEAHLPNLLSDIASIVDAQSQADPQFRTNRLYTRLDAAEVRRQLIGQNGYTDAELPTVQTITTKLNALGYYPQKVAKSAPKKRFLKPTRSSTR